MIINPLDRTYPWSMKSTWSTTTTLPPSPFIPKKAPNPNHIKPPSGPTSNSFFPIASLMIITTTAKSPSPYINLPKVSYSKEIAILNLPAEFCYHMANPKPENFFIEPNNYSEISFIYLKNIHRPLLNHVPFVALMTPLLAPIQTFSLWKINHSFSIVIFLILPYAPIGNNQLKSEYTAEKILVLMRPISKTIKILSVVFQLQTNEKKGKNHQRILKSLIWKALLQTLLPIYNQNKKLAPKRWPDSWMSTFKLLNRRGPMLESELYDFLQFKKQWGPLLI